MSNTALYKSRELIDIVNDKQIITVDKDSYITKDLVCELSIQSDNIKHYSDYVNELFINYSINGTIYEKIFKDFDVTKINTPNRDLSDKVFISVAIKNNVSIPTFSMFYYKVLSMIKLPLSAIIMISLSFLMPLYALFKYRCKYRDGINNNMVVIRSKATDEKISILKNQFDIRFFVDDIVYKNTNYNSIYCANFHIKILALLRVPFITIRDMYFLYKESKQLFDGYFIGHLLYYYILRVPVKSTYEYYLDNLIKSFNGTYYSGNKEDRYAICEKRITKKYNIKSVCLPHGLEYSFKEPAGLFGDLFYCITNESLKKLSTLYNSNQFIFDNNIVRKMLNKKYIDTSPNRMVVFFTEYRGEKDIEINTNIISNILKKNITLYLKLHPNDNKSNYSKFSDNLIILDDINQAINNNICIARKSTILIEALYNNSIAIAILINDSDKNFFNNFFPSLSDKNIIKFYSMTKFTTFVNSKIKRG